MNREPSAHSMTVETSDRENLAERVFLLEHWKANAVQKISQLEGERDEARGEVEAARKEIARLGAVVDAITAQRDEAESNLRCQLIQLIDTPVGGCTKCAEMRTSLDESKAALQAQTDAHRNASTELIKLRGNDEVKRAELARLYKERSERETQLLDLQKANAKLDKEGAELANERDDYQRRFDLVRDMFRGALDSL